MQHTPEARPHPGIVAIDAMEAAVMDARTRSVAGLPSDVRLMPGSLQETANLALMAVGAVAAMASHFDMSNEDVKIMFQAFRKVEGGE